MTPRTRGGVQFAGNDGKYICIYQRVLNYTPLYQRLLYYTYIYPAGPLHSLGLHQFVHYSRREPSLNISIRVETEKINSPTISI